MNFNFKPSQKLSIVYENKPQLDRFVEVLSVHDNYIMINEKDQIKRFNKTRILSVVDKSHLFQGKISYDLWEDRLQRSFELLNI